MSRQDIINIVIGLVGGCSEYVLAENSEHFARHVCINGGKIWLLPMLTCPINDGYGNICNVQYYKCNICGKVIINKNTLPV